MYAPTSMHLICYMQKGKCTASYNKHDTDVDLATLATNCDDNITDCSNVINPPRSCAARVTTVGLCVCICLSVHSCSGTTGYESAYERYKRLQINEILKNKMVIFQKQLRSGDMA